MFESRICPVCRAVVERTVRGNVGAHLAGPDVCPMSGEPYLVALRPAEVMRVRPKKGAPAPLLRPGAVLTEQKREETAK